MALNFQTSFYFNVSTVGAASGSDVAFQDVSGLSKETKTEEVGCGGENRFKYRLPTTVSFPNLSLKRGLAPVDSPLIAWCAQTLDAGLSKPITTKNIEVNLLNENGQACVTWTVIGAYPVKWVASDLKSDANSILIETIELGYNYFDLAKTQGAEV